MGLEQRTGTEYRLVLAVGISSLFFKQNWRAVKVKKRKHWIRLPLFDISRLNCAIETTLTSSQLNDTLIMVSVLLPCRPMVCVVGF